MISTTDEIIASILEELRGGNPAPLAALIRTGNREILEHQELREEIAIAVEKTWRTGKKGASVKTQTRNLRLVIFIYALDGAGLKPNAEGCAIAAEHFKISEDTAKDIWKRRQTGDWWLKAREIGVSTRLSRALEADQIPSIYQQSKLFADSNKDSLRSIRLAAANGQLKIVNKNKG